MNLSRLFCLCQFFPIPFNDVSQCVNSLKINKTGDKTERGSSINIASKILGENFLTPGFNLHCRKVLRTTNQMDSTLILIYTGRGKSKVCCKGSQPEVEGYCDEDKHSCYLRLGPQGELGARMRSQFPHPCLSRSKWHHHQTHGHLSTPLARLKVQV